MTLNEFFAAHPKCALGFSGGVDSAYLLYAGVQAGADIRPYYIKTAFQPRFERDDALRLAGELGVEVTVLELDALAQVWPRLDENTRWLLEARYILDYSDGELARELEGKSPIDFPRETAMGALALYISDPSVVNFQPMNVNFGLIPPLGYRVKGKRNKNAELSKRALEALGQLDLE